MTNGPGVGPVTDGYEWMLCDGFDEWPAVMQRFALKMAESGKPVQIVGDPDGGHSNFENAEPQGFLELVPNSRSEKGSVVAALRSGSAIHIGLEIETVEVNYNYELWERAGIVAAEHLARNPESRIAVTAARLDQLQVAFLSRVVPRGMNIQRISAGRRIVDQAMARAILALALLCHPNWLLTNDDELPLTLNGDDLSALWAYTCDLDPVRSVVLSRHVIPHVPDLPLPDGRLVDRIGAIAVEAYQRLRGWVAEYREGVPIPVGQFVRRGFGELIAAGRLPSEDSIAADRLARAAERFERTLRGIAPDIGRGYCALLREGYIGAQFLPDLDVDASGILIGSSFTLALSDLDWDVVILLDLTSPSWFAGTDKPLFDSQVLSAYWPGGRMTEDIQAALAEERAYRLISNLIGRTQLKAVLMASELDVLGFEQNGELYDRLSDVLVDSPALA